MTDQEPLQLGKTKEEWDQIIKDFQNQPMQFIRSPPKPICLIKIDTYGQSNPNSLLSDIRSTLETKMPDYYIFVIPITIDFEKKNDQIEFQVFYEKDFTPIQYEELKALIISSLPEKK